MKSLKTEDEVKIELEKGEYYRFDVGLEALEKINYRYPSLREALHSKGSGWKEQTKERMETQWIDAAIARNKKDELIDKLIIYEGVRGLEYKMIESGSIYYYCAGPHRHDYVRYAYVQKDFSFEKKREFPIKKGLNGFVSCRELSPDLLTYLFGGKYLDQPAKTLGELEAGIYIPAADLVERNRQLENVTTGVGGRVDCTTHKEYPALRPDEILPLAHKRLSIEVSRYAKVIPIAKDNKNRRIVYEPSLGPLML